MSTEQVIFGYVPGEDRDDGVPVLLFIISQAAWDYMASGLGHSFDMTKLGIPLKALIHRCETRESGMADLRSAGIITDRTTDARHVDLSFDEKKKPDG